MYVMILMAAYYVADAQPPLVIVTRPSLEHYASKEMCAADGERQAKLFMQEVPKTPILFAGKCVEVKGPAGIKS
jgi:hypothetical protein